MFHLLSLLRHRRTRVALTAAVASLSLAALPAGAHAALVQGQPQNVVGGFFDDHSIGGDNHLGWGYTGTGGTSQAEPLAITFGTTLTNTGPDQFRVCGYNAAGGWMAAYQVAAATCPATAGGAGAQDGWFRYVTANHSEPTATPAGSAFNRWHLMDLQRFALVPLPTSLGGPGRRVHRVGHDVGHVPQRRRPDHGLRSGRDPGRAARHRDPGGRREDDAGAQPGAPTRSASRSPPRRARRSPTAGTRSSRSRTRTASTAAARASPARRSASPACTGYAPQVTQVGGQPATCYVPAAMLAGLAGPGGRDPMAGAAASTCTPLADRDRSLLGHRPDGRRERPRAAVERERHGLPDDHGDQHGPGRLRPAGRQPDAGLRCGQPARHGRRPVDPLGPSSHHDELEEPTRPPRCASSSARASAACGSRAACGRRPRRRAPCRGASRARATRATCGSATRRSAAACAGSTGSRSRRRRPGTRRPCVARTRPAAPSRADRHPQPGEAERRRAQRERRRAQAAREVSAFRGRTF